MLRQPTSTARALALAAGLATASSCTVSQVGGPQLTDVPVGFGLDSEVTSARRLLPGREPVKEAGYYRREGTKNGSIIVAEYEGNLDQGAAEAAHEAIQERWARGRITFSDLETSLVDGREAWRWVERQERSLALLPHDPLRRRDLRIGAIDRLPP